MLAQHTTHGIHTHTLKDFIRFVQYSPSPSYNVSNPSTPRRVWGLGRFRLSFSHSTMLMWFSITKTACRKDRRTSCEDEWAKSSMKYSEKPRTNIETSRELSCEGGWMAREWKSFFTHTSTSLMIWECNHGEWMSQQHGIPWEDRSGEKKLYTQCEGISFFDFSDGLRLRCRKTSASWLNLIARIPPHKETLWWIFFAKQHNRICCQCLGPGRRILRQLERMKC